jgi:hypothetical protein
MVVVARSSSIHAFSQHNRMPRRQDRLLSVGQHLTPTPVDGWHDPEHGREGRASASRFAEVGAGGLPVDNAHGRHGKVKEWRFQGA